MASSPAPMVATVAMGDRHLLRRPVATVATGVVAARLASLVARAAMAVTVGALRPKLPGETEATVAVQVASAHAAALEAVVAMRTQRPLAGEVVLVGVVAVLPVVATEAMPVTAGLVAAQRQLPTVVMGALADHRPAPKTAITAATEVMHPRRRPCRIP